MLKFSLYVLLTLIAITVSWNSLHEYGEFTQSWVKDEQDEIGEIVDIFLGFDQKLSEFNEIRKELDQLEAIGFIDDQQKKQLAADQEQALFKSILGGSSHLE